MKFQKKHVISAALILALGAAVYVNWQFGGAPKTPVKELGATSYVNATVTATADSAEDKGSLSKAQRELFAAERTKRQNTQDAALEQAQKVFDLENAKEEDKTEAQKRRSHREQKFRGAQIFRAETKHQRVQDRGIRNNLVGRAGRQRTGNI